MLKKLFALILIVAGCLIIWCAFALWTGLYSVYSYPPSAENPDGETLLVTSEDGEPTFNSPAYVAPVKPVEKKEGISFGTIPHPKHPISERVIVKLPYIQWAYEQSLNTKQ